MIAVGAIPLDIAITPDREVIDAYVTNSETRIRSQSSATSTNTVTTTVPVGANPVNASSPFKVKSLRG